MIPQLTNSAAFSLSLKSKIMLLCCGLAATVAMLVGAAFYVRTVDNLLTTATENLAAETRLIAGRFQSSYDAIQNDTRIISHMQPIAELINAHFREADEALDTREIDLWRTRLSRIFASVLLESPSYTQIRFIGLADNGRELVRINRTGDGIEVVPKAKLQNKADEPYVQTVMQGHQKTFFFSRVTLNRELGTIESALIPTIRAIMPVEDAFGQTFGMVVINVDFNAMTSQMFADASPTKNTFLINQSGDYREYDPNTQTTQLEFHERLTKKRPDFIAEIQAAESDEAAILDGDNISYYARMRVSKGSDGEFVGAVLRVPRQELLTDTNKARHETILLTLLLTVTAALVAGLCTHKLMAPLQQMTEEIRANSGSDDSLKLPVHLHDEIGDLARAFQEMASNLINSENRANAVFENTTDGIFTFDKRGKIEKCNSAFAKIFGYRDEEVLGKNVNDLIPESFARNPQQNLESDKLSSEQNTLGIGREAQAKHRDGSALPIELSISEMQIDGARLFSSIVRDIRDRKAAESELRLLQLAVNYSKDMLLIITADLSDARIVFASNASFEITGYTPDELIGQSPHILEGENTDQAQLRAMLDSLRKNQAFSAEMLNYAKDGREYWVHVTIVPVLDEHGVTTHFASLERDITVARRNKENLLKTSKIIEAISKSQAQFISGQEHDDVFSGILESSMSLSGSQFGVIYELLEQADGDPLKTVRSIAKQSSNDESEQAAEVSKQRFLESSEHEAIVDKVIDSGRTFIESAPKLQLVHGANPVNDIQKERSKNSLATPLYSNSGQFVGVLVISNSPAGYDDQLLKYLDPLLASCANLLRAEKTDELQRKAEREIEKYTLALERSNKELDAFAYSASHDLKAPLRVIDNTSGWLAEDLDQYLDEDSRENIDLLRSRVKRMEVLLDDLLEYSRIGRKMDDSYAQLVSGQEMADSILELVPDPKSFTVEFSQDFKALELPLMPLQQVLINLVSNAIKHHDKATGTIDISVENLSSRYRFSVRDDGPGIANEFQQQVFNMFQTLKPRDQVEGSGMGLAVVKKHIEHFGGHITLESKVGRGCVFSFTWPIKQTSYG